MTPLPTAVFIPLRAFILARIVPAGTDVVQGLDNGVPMPPGPFVLMTRILQVRLSTNRHEYDDVYPAPGSAQTIEASMRLDVQLDFYGPESGAWAAAAELLLRDELACKELAPDVQPLYCADAMQVALVTAEQRYLDRWLLTASFQYNPSTTVLQQFADAASVVLVEVDTRYPPN